MFSVWTSYFTSYVIYWYIFQMLGRQRVSGPPIENGNLATISHSGCSFFAYSETIMNLNRCTHSNSDIFWFRESSEAKRQLVGAGQCKSGIN